MKLKGIHKEAYHLLRDIYQLGIRGVSFQILPAWKLIPFFTAEQLEAIELKVHIKNLQRAPKAAKAYAKINHFGNIFYYAKEIQNLISPFVISNFPHYHIPVVETE